ncbi:MAG: transposase [Acidobacteriota bacterium]
MPRLQRELSATGVYHVMIRGNERKDIFLDDDDRQRFLQTLVDKKNKDKFSIYAYCLMSNHAHLLVRDTLEEPIALIMKKINGSYAYYFNKKYRRIGHVFHDRFKSETVENDKYLLTVTRYIHHNPLKAGIVDNLEAYRWSSYHDYISKRSSDFVDRELILGMFSDGRGISLVCFKEFMKQESSFSGLEVDEEDVKQINGIQEATEYVKERLREMNQQKMLEEIKDNKALRKTIIADLRSRSNLSIREIGTLLGVDRGVVERIKAK